MDSAKVGQLACQKDSCLKKLLTKVVSCEPKNDAYEVVLQDTILFPTGGGQPFDLATIDNIPVLECYRKGMEAVHLLRTPFEVGQTVEVVLDWDRRFDHMQQHSGQHLISDIAEDHFGWLTYGWNMGKDLKSFVEFEKVMPSQEQLDELEMLVNEFIRAAHAIEIDLETHLHEAERPDTLPEDIQTGVLRQIKMGSIPFKPCCGTHVQKTSDIQCVKFLNLENIRGGNVRLWFSCGNRVLKLLHQSLARDKELNVLLSSGPDQFPDRVKKIKQQTKDFMKANKVLEKEMKQIKKELEQFQLKQ
jgi:misacylated tRNA(Ala) deacylase